MKVLFDTHSLTLQNHGGQEVQMSQTKKYLEKLGVEVKYYNKFEDQISDYDIYHLFGSNSIEHLNLIKHIKNLNIPIVLTPVYWNSFEKEINDSKTFSQKIFVLTKELQKISERKLSYSIPLLNPVNYYLNNANIIMPNSKLEAKHLSNNFKFKNNMSVIHNGVESFYRKGDKNIFIDKYNMENFILFVGRIEPKKNVLTLIKAVNDSSHKLVLIGDTNSDPEYYMMCKNNAGNNVNFLGNIPHNSEMLRSAYHAAKCFVLPSWLETPGIAALEASLAGCNLVITDRGSTKEYFKDKVIYCDPKNLNSIKKGIEKGMNLNEKTDLSNYIIDNFSWQNIAKNILIEYNKIIS